MRNVYLLTFVLILVSGCSNNQDSFETVDFSINTLTGVWKLTETYISQGGET